MQQAGLETPYCTTASLQRSGNISVTKTQCQVMVRLKLVCARTSMGAAVQSLRIEDPMQTCLGVRVLSSWFSSCTLFNDVEA